MTAVPPIYTYAADNPDTPAHIRYAAAMDQSGPGMHWLCMAPTREQAREKLAAWWLKCEAERPKRAPRKAAETDGAEAAPEPAAAEDEDVI